ncbi:hypothetical protein BUKK_11395 [Pasteurella multocida subsp. multocida]|nr:hypothetical protein [Pasteurella multocida]KLV11768.1 hypothetical protein BUKK_11395 [Pasteurella multocida subsp. multocida]
MQEVVRTQVLHQVLGIRQHQAGAMRHVHRPPAHQQVDHRMLSQGTTN